MSLASSKFLNVQIRLGLLNHNVPSEFESNRFPETLLCLFGLILYVPLNNFSVISGLNQY